MFLLQGSRSQTPYKLQTQFKLRELILPNCVRSIKFRNNSIRSAVIVLQYAMSHKVCDQLWNEPLNIKKNIKCLDTEA